MDRPASIRSWRLTWPLLALAAACAGWQAVRLGAASGAGDAPAATTSFVEIPPTRPTLTGEPARPNLFCVSELPQSPSPPEGVTRLVSAADAATPPAAPAARSRQLESIAHEADCHSRQGYELAGRGAYYAARSEFIAALRLLAQGLDAEQQTALHSQSLAAGLTALKEAEDFLPKGSHIEADLDLSAIIGSHRTPVLKDADLKALTPLLALQCYFTFAQEQLAAAAGHEVAGSMALRGLGKLHTSLAGNKAMHVRAGEPKAMAFFQAALLVSPQNYMAANDLGVLLAQCGNYAQARGVLEHSLSICPQSIGWHNLAVVYQRLGQLELARRADWQAEVARRAEAARLSARQGPPPQPVRWVDPQTFAQTPSEPAYVGPAMPERSATPQKTAKASQPTRN